MFIQDQSQKVIFNMKFYILKNMGNIIQIHDSKGELVGNIAEYDDVQLSEMLTQEAKDIMQFCAANHNYCLYKFPTNQELQKVIENGQY
jgi:hypothetical protein